MFCEQFVCAGKFCVESTVLIISNNGLGLVERISIHGMNLPYLSAPAADLRNPEMLVLEGRDPPPVTV